MEISTIRRKPPTFTVEERTEAVGAVRTSGPGIHRVVQGLDLTEAVVRRCVQQAEAEGGHGLPGRLADKRTQEFGQPPWRLVSLSQGALLPRSRLAISLPKTVQSLEVIAST